ncbi:putative glycolipid-binding domain-containing protein [Pendulispora albinea]|uniref:Glycolipid-binding domain-containing protein n=1 Tax=Pendulispora albinea TaxID=2741071 RepID=A0ABZ2LUF6_9BACT
MHIARVWTKEEGLGTELGEIELGHGTLTATGFAIGTDPEPYRLEYHLTTGDAYVTAKLSVRAMGHGFRRALELVRAPSGRWSCTTESEGYPTLGAPGGDLAGLDGALDCDLGLSPVTNSMPVLRHRLHETEGAVDFVMAWVSVPDLAVIPARQRYTFVARQGTSRIVRYEQSDFRSDIEFDEHGVVRNYPQLARTLR